MPLHLPPLSRRQFLVAAGGGILAWNQTLAAERAADPHRWFLTADTHIAADRNRIHNKVNLAEHLSRVVADALKLDPRPAGLILNGDAALTSGLPGDYATLVELLGPLTKAIPTHITLGNHDDRDHFRVGILRGLGKSPLESHHVAVIELPRANWFLLDSLDQVNKTPGLLGKNQLEWLAKVLDSRADKPALIVIHHDPRWPGDMRTPSLIDSDDFYAVLTPRKQVKAVFCGHTHVWRRDQRDGIHLVNLPPVAYVFKEGLPSGWVDVRLREAGATLQLHALDQHPKDGEVVELTWRS